MLSLLKSLIYAGAGLDAHRRRYIVNANVFAVIVIAITMPYPFVYLYLQVDVDPLLLAGSLIFLGAYATVILFNYLRLHTLSKLLFFCHGSLRVVCDLYYLWQRNWP